MNILYFNFDLSADNYTYELRYYAKFIILLLS